MVDDLLQFSRTGRVQLQADRVDMRGIVDEVLSQMPADALHRCEVVVDALPGVHGDVALLRQVWANLIGNALKFSRDAPGPRIEISGRIVDGHCEYRVRDNGVGFDSAHAAKLFGVFERLHRAEDYEGTGVGLAIVHRIVTRHGGSVCAVGSPGKGAEIRFVLPRGDGDPSAAGSSALRAVT